MPREVAASPISAEAARGLCTLLGGPGAAVLSGNPRADARLSIEVVAAAAVWGSLDVSEMERHPASVQAFIPMDASAYLVVVSPPTKADVPDLSDLRAFIVPGDAVLQYAAGVWHVPIRTVGKPGRFGMAVNKAGTAADCEFVRVEPFKVTLPDSQPAGVRA
ncbi:MAG: ureidoglycolate lyase [Pararhizobium sp.]